VVKHENAVISRMVQTGSVLRYDHLLRPEYFNGFNVDVYKALRLYEQTYGVCMDTKTFRHQFENFVWIENEIQVEWYADELAQDYVKGQVSKLLAETMESIEENPKVVTSDLLDKLRELSPFLTDAVAGRVGLTAHGRTRALELRKKFTDVKDDLSGITTGFSIIDAKTNGTQPGEIEFYVARPGNGKSLALLWSCYQAVLQGKRVSLISPEMSAYEMGLRLDAMMFHMSSMTMQSGRMSMEDIEDYSDKIEAMIDNMPGDIMFRDTEKLRRKFTTGDVRRIIEEDKPDLVAIDGILLINPIAKYKDTRNRVINIMDELKEIVVSTQVPMRLAHQVNRESEQRVGRRKGKEEPSPLAAIPQLHELAESGSTEQYANRVIALRYTGGRLYFAIRKNRNGPEGDFFSAKFEIDIGKVSDERPESLEGASDSRSEPKQIELDEDVPF
jgi:replicative DNA helicase